MPAYRVLTLLTTIASGILLSAECRAGVVDFENVPGVVTPFQGLSIGNQFAATQGMRFRLADGSLPVLAEVGDPAIGFVSGMGGIHRDELLPGQQVGRFFLVDDEVRNNVPQDLIVDFVDPVAFVAGSVLDVEFRPQNDTREVWSIQFFDANDVMLSSMLIDPLVIDPMFPHTGDGLATRWEYSRMTSDISRVRISYIGDALGGPGFGFDDFMTSVAPIPEPSTTVLVLICSCSAGYLRRQRRIPTGP